MSTGYSTTPLERKLGIKEGFSCLIFNAPPHILTWINSLDYKLEIQTTYMNKEFDFILSFCQMGNDLEIAIMTSKPCLAIHGMFWIAWPKGKSNITTDLNREIVRDYVLANGLVDIKVAAIDENWSALKFVYRLKDRK